MLQKLFDSRNPFWRFLAKLFDVMVLNLCWIIFSIPVFTVGATTAAAYSVCFQIQSESHSGALKAFWAAFRENFRQGILMGLILLVLCAMFGFDIVYFMHLQQFLPKVVQLLLTGLCILLLIGTLLTSIYGFALQALFENTIRETLKNAFILALCHPLRSLFILVTDLAVLTATVLSLYYLPELSVVLLLLCVGLALFLNSLIQLPILRKYIAEPDDLEAEPEIYD